MKTSLHPVTEAPEFDSASISVPVPVIFVITSERQQEMPGVLKKKKKHKKNSYIKKKKKLKKLFKKIYIYILKKTLLKKHY